MAITKIKISNFKSFGDTGEIRLGNFNVLIGANASGKSNLVQVFRFLRDIQLDGLENAIYAQGGTELLRNIDSKKDFSLQITTDNKISFLLPKKENGRKKDLMAETEAVDYKFTIGFHKKGTGFKVTEDKLTLHCSFYKKITRNKKYIQGERLGEGTVEISKKQNAVGFKIDIPKEQSIRAEDIITYDLNRVFKSLKTMKIGAGIPKSGSLLMEGYIPLYPYIFEFSDFIGDLGIYDFDPKLLKESFRITGKAELEEDGSNLTTVLKSIKEDGKKKREFALLIGDVLPFVKDWKITKSTEYKAQLFTLQERYFKKYLPAPSLSDGTVNIAALIAAIYFEKNSIVVIEEPERNIHPFLISKVVDMLRDASRNKQIIVTTHNPEIVKHAGLDNILYVSRDSKGYSIVSTLIGKEEIQVFLKNEMGLDELYVQNLLEM
jgi:predicted ATPase